MVMNQMMSTNNYCFQCNSHFCLHTMGQLGTMGMSQQDYNNQGLVKLAALTSCTITAPNSGSTSVVVKLLLLL